MNKSLSKTFFFTMLLMGLTATAQACVDDTECSPGTQFCSNGICCGIGQHESGGTCCGSGQSFCAFSGVCQADSQFCGACQPDASCNTQTCVGSTCTDSCGNVHNGIKQPNCGCAVDTCVGSTCGDGCGGSCAGTQCCPSCACAASTCIGSTCANGCGGFCAGTKAPSCSCAASTCIGSTCSDGCGGTCAGTQSCCGSLAPVITNALSFTGTVGVPFSFQLTASNSPTSFGASNLPSGLLVNAVNGLISGTPVTAGTAAVALSASNCGGTGNATLNATINAAQSCTCPGANCGSICSPGTCRDSCGNAGACTGLLTCTVEQQNAAGDPLSGAHAYPTPYKPSVHANGITFNNLNSDASVKIKIFTVKGELVQELHNTSGAASVNWNVTNKDGQAVASGVYVYRITNSVGKEKKGKLLITR